MAYNKPSEKSETKAAKRPRGRPSRVAYDILSAVMPAKNARVLSGYSPDSHVVPRRTDTTLAIRERLQTVAGCTLADQVQWYVDMREDATAPHTDRINAAKRIDAVLGYDAPAKVDITQQHNISGAITAMHAIAQVAGMSPAAIKAAVAGRQVAGTAQAREIAYPVKKIEAGGVALAQVAIPCLDGTRRARDHQNSTLQIVNEVKI